jgi:hypothetical protein
MIGLLFGSFILGIISDHFGRMKALLVLILFIVTECVIYFD